LLSFLVERFVHFSGDVYIERPNKRPYFRQDSTESPPLFTDFTVPGLGKIVGPEKPFEPEVLAHISRNYER